jgi:EAL domain-containing protein (putative c-di-GMP-specific phosphodiesterase class I)
VLLVDDEPALVSAFARQLQRHGFDVHGVSDGSRALERILGESFDVVVTDIRMPNMDGMTLLRKLREKDVDVPVIVLTAAPTLETAVSAVEHGAMRYLSKPIDEEELLAAVSRAAHIRQLARLRRDAEAVLRGREPALPALAEQFDRALGKLWNAFQPVVLSSKKEVWGFEALARCDEPALKTPDVLFDAAERLGRVHDIGRVIRRNIAAEIPSAPPDAKILVNLHPQDLLDSDLYDAEAPLARHASRVILEITERAPLDGIDDLRTRVRTLRSLGYRIALDDMGAGYAGLAAFTRLEPEIVKLDMLFVRGIERDFTKQHLVKSIISMCGQLFVRVIAEGVETKGERGMLRDLGCDLLQGYLFARPERSFPGAKNI